MKRKDCYEVIGTNKEAMKRDMNNEPRTEKQIDDFLKMKYEDTLKSIKIMKEIAEARGDQNRLKELEEEEQEATLAYQKIKSEELRKEYHSEIERKKEKIVPTYKRKSPYEVLNIDKEDLKQYTDAEIDKIIEESRNTLIAQYSEELDSTSEKFYSFRQKIQLKIDETKEAYGLISTAKKRDLYTERTQKEEKEKQKMSVKEIEEKYSHAREYKPYLINNESSSDNKSLQDKMVQREEVVLSEEYSYNDKENRQLRLRRIAEIKFQNRIGVGELSISEYEVKRIIDGQETVDIVYTDAPIIYLSIDQKTGKPINPDYYDCFINKLLAEETIAGSKYNGGFIGGIEKNQEGNYYITLEKERLSPMEQEQLTAVMIMEQKEQNIEEKGEGKVI